MSLKVKYSIIIPHKDIPSLLERCLNSIPIKETIQVIIVDDDSDPKKVDFDNFPGKKRHYTQIVYTKAAQGAGYARNIGLGYATGKWLIFADSDDFFNSCFFEAIERNFESDADLIYFSATSVNSNTLNPSDRNTRLVKIIENYNPRDENSVDDLKYSTWEPWSKMFNRQYIAENEFYFDEVIVGNDLGFVLKAGHYSRKIEVDEDAIYCVTSRNESLTYENSEEAFDNRFRAVLLTNKYMRSFNRKYIVSLIPHLYHGRKYGVMKIIKMIWVARQYGNNIFYGTNGYFRKLFSKFREKI